MGPWQPGSACQTHAHAAMKARTLFALPVTLVARSRDESRNTQWCHSPLVHRFFDHAHLINCRGKWRLAASDALYVS